jgi:hypothetical protein
LEELLLRPGGPPWGLFAEFPGGGAEDELEADDELEPPASVFGFPSGPGGPFFPGSARAAAGIKIVTARMATAASRRFTFTSDLPCHPCDGST